MEIPVNRELVNDLLDYLDERRVSRRDKKAQHFYSHLLATRYEHERNQSMVNQINLEQAKKDE